MSDLTTDAAIKTDVGVEDEPSESGSDDNTDSSSQGSTGSEKSGSSASALNSNEERVEDPEVKEEYRRLLRLSLAPISTPKKLEFRGKEVTRTTMVILKHVVTNLMDHFGDSVMPTLRFKCEKLSHLPYDDRYKSKREAPADKWYSEISANYTIDGRIYNGAVVAFNGVHIDMKNKVSSKGTTSMNYGETWINLYMPNNTLRQFSTAFTNDTNWPQLSCNGWRYCGCD
jgi:hypothetical protein